MIELDNGMLRGSYPPLITPFTDSGEVDLPAYTRLVDRQIVCGSHGIVINGTTAEPSVLTVNERKAIAEQGMATAAGRVPVVVASGSQSLAETVELTEHATTLGAAAVLVVTPYYVRPPQRGLVEYFVEVAAHTDRPLLIYHIPTRAAVDVTLSTLEAVADRVPHFVGIKHASTDLGFVSDVLARFGPEFRVLAGLEELSFPMMALGAAGVVNAVANIAPAKVAQLYEAAAAGKLNDARQLHDELLELSRAIFFETNPIPLKYMLKRIGVLANNSHRLPMTGATPEVKSRCNGVLARARLI